LVISGLCAAVRLARANFTRLASPMKLTLCLTHRCQARCRTCNIWQREPTAELTTEDLLAFISRNRDVAWLDLTGGEIFLRPDIAEILQAIAHSWPRLHVLHFPTNGLLTSRIVAAAASLAKVRAFRIIVTVSLDGDEALNDDVRGVAGSYRRGIETFKALRRLRGVETVIGFTMSRFNAGRLQDTFEACRREYPALTARDFHVNVAQTSGHYYQNAGIDDLLPARDLVRSELDQFRRQAGFSLTPTACVERQFLTELGTFMDTGRTPVRCHALRSSCFIDPSGTVYPCVAWSRELGNLRDTGMVLAPLWTGAAATSTQREIWEGSCPQCWTACEAYQSLLGNVLRPFRRRTPARSLNQALPT
jgi:radical SAM protein with 4Fe4S-binding SPASM domain